MKKSNVFTFVLLAVALFISSASIAQGDHNEFGFYVDQEMSDTHVVAAIYDVINVHMVITHPYNEDLLRPVEQLNGLEFSYSFQSVFTFVLYTTWVNPGDVSDFSYEVNSHILNWAVPLQNVDNAIYLGTKTFLILSTDPVGVYLAPTSQPIIPGHMAFQDYDDFSIHPLYPTSGSYDDPVFGFNMEVVATEGTSFGSLKALYR